MPIVLLVVAILSVATLGLTGAGANASRLATIAEQRARLRAAAAGAVQAFAFQRFAREFDADGGTDSNQSRNQIQNLTIELEFSSEAARISLNAYEEAEVLRQLQRLDVLPQEVEDLSARFIAARRKPTVISHPLALLIECEALGTLGALFGYQFTAIRAIGTRTTAGGPEATDPLTGQPVSRTWLPELYRVTSHASTGAIETKAITFVVPLDTYPSFRILARLNGTSGGGNACSR